MIHLIYNINVETLNCIHVDVSVFAMRVSIFVTGDFMSTFKIQSSQLFAADDLFHFYVVFLKFLALFWHMSNNCITHN